MTQHHRKSGQSANGEKGGWYTAYWEDNRADNRYRDREGVSKVSSVFRDRRGVEVVHELLGSAEGTLTEVVVAVTRGAGVVAGVVAHMRTACIRRICLRVIRFRQFPHEGVVLRSMAHQRY